MTFPTPYRSKPLSLNAKIAHAERSLLNRKQHLSIGINGWLFSCKQHLITPISLGLTAGCGFVLGELSRSCPFTANPHSAATPEAKTSGGHSLISAVIFIYRIYTALPLIILITDYFSSDQQTDNPE